MIGNYIDVERLDSNCLVSVLFDSIHEGPGFKVQLRTNGRGTLMHPLNHDTS